jgi:chromosome segregation ATPase
MKNKKTLTETEQHIGGDYRMLKQAVGSVINKLQKEFQTYEQRTTQMNEWMKGQIESISASHKAGVDAQGSVVEKGKDVEDLMAQIEKLKDSHKEELQKAQATIDDLRGQVAASLADKQGIHNNLTLALSDMDKELRGSELKVKGLTHDVDRLSQRLERARGDRAQFNQLKDALETKIDELEKENSELAEKHENLVGQFNDLLKQVKATKVYTKKDSGAGADTHEESTKARKTNFREWMKSKGKVL